MRKYIFVFAILVGVESSIECYSFFRGAKSEFTDIVHTCIAIDSCVTATYNDLIFTTCAKSDCTDGNEENYLTYREILQKTARKGGVMLALEDIKLSCCKEDLCNRPTAVPIPFPNKCYVFTGEKERMKSLDPGTCDFGTACVTAYARGYYIKTYCVVECSEFTKKMAEFEVHAQLTKLIGPIVAEIAPYQVRSECCTGNLCNGFYNKYGLLVPEGGATTLPTWVFEPVTRPGSISGLRGFGKYWNNRREGGKKPPLLRETSESGPKEEGVIKGTNDAAPVEEYEVFHAWSDSEDDASSRENVKHSLSSLLPFTLGLLSMVYSMQ